MFHIWVAVAVAARLFALAFAMPLANEFGTLDDVVRGTEMSTHTANIAPYHDNFWDSLSPLPQHIDHHDPSDPSFDSSDHSTEHSPLSFVPARPVTQEELSSHSFQNLHSFSDGTFARYQPQAEPMEHTMTFMELLRQASLPNFLLTEHAPAGLFGHVPTPQTYIEPARETFESIPLQPSGQEAHRWAFNSLPASPHSPVPNAQPQQVQTSAGTGHETSTVPRFQLIHYSSSDQGHRTSNDLGQVVYSATESQPSSAESVNGLRPDHLMQDASLPEAASSSAATARVVDKRLSQVINVPESIDIDFDNSVDKIVQGWLRDNTIKALGLTNSKDASFHDIAASVWSRGVRHLHRVIQDDRDFLVTYHRNAPFEDGWTHRTMGVWEQHPAHSSKLIVRGFYPLTHRQRLAFHPATSMEYTRDMLRLYRPGSSYSPLEYKRREFVSVDGASLPASQKIFALPDRFRYAPDKSVDAMMQDFDFKTRKEDWQDSTVRSEPSVQIIERFTDRSRKLWARVNRLRRITYQDRTFWLTLHYKSTMLPPKGGGPGFIIWELDQDGRGISARGIYPKRVNLWPNLEYLGDSSVEFHDPVRPLP